MSKRLVLLGSLLFGAFAIGCGDGNPSQPAECGDGKVDPDESCDDGNSTDGDGCDSNCTATACGNGLQTMDEGCDDGNAVDGDGCDNNCMVTGCGNAVVSDGETCDDGNTVNGDGCDNNCTATACGNDVMSTGEICDDGNAVDGDGCDSNCTVTGCGNEVVAGDEECDDGNTTSIDGCSATCETETLEVEPNEDGTTEVGGPTNEGNDFGSANADTNGAFDTSVTIYGAITPAGDEDVFKFTNPGTGPVVVRFDTWNMATGFGIGVTCGTESIDTSIIVRDAAGTELALNDDRPDSDYCSGLDFPLLAGESVYAHVIEREDDGEIASYALVAAYAPVVCGDGSVGPGETCDDGNTVAGDGCSDTCQAEGTPEVEPNEDGSIAPDGPINEGNDYASANADTNGAFDASTVILAAITPTGDEDVFAFTNPGTMPVTARFDTWNLASGFGLGVSCGDASIDTSMRIRDAAGTSLASNDDRPGSDYCAGLEFGILPGQTVYAHVFEREDNNEIASYALEVVYTPVVCGDSTVGFGEQCDDGNTMAGDGCDASCQIEVVCGDGTVHAPEECDDGNTMSGDGCSDLCEIEVICGDDTLGEGEQCDDGNTMAGDGCSDTCQLEGATTESEPNEDGTPSTGGTGTVGNDFSSANADGPFSGDVLIAAAVTPAGDEDVFAFTNSTAVPADVRFDIWNAAPGFGIGVPCGTSIDTGMHIRNAGGISLQENDDRDGSNDRCSALTFTLAPAETVYAHVVEFGDSATIASYALEVTYTPVVCGDGVVGGAEQCDDGNLTPGDGCSDVCEIEIICGDGVIGGTEQCDDGNTDPNDGCSDICEVEGSTDEVEPNGTTAEATASSVKISADSLIDGSMGTVGDLDLYEVTVATPTVVRFETFSLPFDCLGGTTIDLRLLDSTGAQIVADTEGFGIAGCGALMMYLDAGTYYIQVEERGNSATVATYFLEVDYQTDRGAETEPNETTVEASTILLGENNVFGFGDHSVNADVDVYSITVPAGARIRAEVIEGDFATETCGSFGVDSRLTLFDENGAQLVDDDDEGRGFCSLIDGTGASPLDPAATNATATEQTYYLMVRQSSFASMTGGQFVYRLQVTLR